MTSPLEWLESHGIGLEERTWLAAYGPLTDPRKVTTVGSLIVPWYRHRFALLRRFARKLMPNIPWGVFTSRFDEAGWEPIGGARPSPEAYAKLVDVDKRAVSLLFQSDRPATAPCQVVDDLLALASRHRIRVVLTVFPEASDLRHWCPDIYRQRVMAALEAGRQQHGFELIDGHDWLPDNSFFDPVHVMASGADDFTARFAGLMSRIDSASTPNVAARSVERR